MKKRITISEIRPGSAACDAGIERGDFLLSINNREPVDILDYRFLAADSYLLLEIEKKNGELWEIEIEKEEYEDLGLDFDEPLITKARTCTNKCIFCFIDQLPPGMRDTVYFKDDDIRLSFLTGNYISLTNTDKKEIERIVRYRMSPINVSVHTTNPGLRKKMLKNRFAGDILEKINIMVKGGIKVNTQIVLCRGINDGRELERTISELAGLHPGVDSISVVPVGLTRWRDGLERLQPYNEDTARSVLEQVGKWQKELLARYGTRLVHAADEFYIMAKMELPEYGEYEGFPQLENGVGLMPQFLYEFDEFLKECDNTHVSCFTGQGDSRAVSIATGLCAYDFIKELAEKLERKYNNLKVTVYPVENGYFGKTVTVSGLLTATDLIARLKDEELGDCLFLSESMLKSGEKLFLDDFTVAELSKILGIGIVTVKNDGAEFIKKVAGLQEK